ncbi:aldo/keto reductase [Thalassotalea sp. LPB0316]|uniref:aldo/keto reductase n=1 Tax=Thalassotalea sp. LPB0316 TaxID=2769490 RepID=UPI001869571D|nr:aldo/keto reductase [Thalassotalea sp. LPB0316]QOL25338.1 aldo/keto reductase [Thalassotalea sp. LPB0316]
MSKQHVLTQYLPNTSRIVYGAMGLGGGWNQNPISQQDIQHTHHIIDTCIDLGITSFDHADIYTFGKAEQVFGQVLKQRPALRDAISIQSKCGIRFNDDLGPKRYDFSKQWISESVDNILARLHIEQLDILLLHRPDPLAQMDEVADVIQKLKQQGKIKHLGVSNMHHGQIALLQQAIDAPIVCNQLELSLNHLAFIENAVTSGCSGESGVNFASSTLEYCQLHKVQIQAWGSLAQGLFSGRDVSDQPQNIQQTTQLVATLADEYQVSTEAIVLAWLMRHPANMQPVIGTTNINRIKACAQVYGIELSREHWYSLYVTARGHELP